MTDIVIVTCIQEKLDNSRLTVRLNRKILGQVVQDRPGKWMVLPPPPPPPPAQMYSSLEAAVNAMVNTELHRDSAS